MPGIMLVYPAIVVPLEVIDVVFVKHGNHLVIDIVHNVVSRHIQVHLVPTEKYVLVALSQSVIGMCLKQI